MIDLNRAEKAVTLLKQQNKTLTTAESCTGGLLSAAITSVSGSSAVFELGFVTYANRIKAEFLGVKEETLAAYGAVSEQTAREMAEGALVKAKADIAVSITGIAGPDSDGTEKPVGLVYIGLAQKNRETSVIKLENHFTKDVRNQNREAAVNAALRLTAEALS